MDIQDERRRQLIDHALAMQAGASHAAVVEHALQNWERLAAHLSPLIGEAGFCALYGRALRLTLPQFSLPSSTASAGSVASLLAGLRETLGLLGAEGAGPVNAVLTDTFTGLLSSLIGDALTIRLMNAAWHDKSEQENTQEHK